MTNVIHINAAEQRQLEIRDAACSWVVRLSAGVTEEKLDGVHVWLKEDPAHMQALMDVARLWDQVSVLSELSDVFPLEEYITQKPVQSGRRYLVGAFVSLLLLLAALQIPLPGWLVDGSEAEIPVIISQSHETRIGQQSTVLLPDGSEVTLNTNSRIELVYSEDSREIVLLRGEGHFKVAKDASRPFRVHLNGGVVEAVGTAFTVQQSSQDVLEITVIEGVVNFTRTEPPAATAAVARPAISVSALQQDNVDDLLQPISLQVGDSVQVNELDGSLVRQTLEPEELVSRLAWRDGMLLFEGDSLEDVIRELSRYTSIRIDVDEEVRNIEVLGYFRTGDIEGILLTMEDTFNIRVDRLSEEHIVLRSE